MQGRKTCAQAGSQEHARLSAPVCAASFLAEDRLPTTDITGPGPGATVTQKTKLHGSEKRSPFLRRHGAGMQAPDSVRSVEVEREAKTRSEKPRLGAGLSVAQKTLFTPLPA
ncbi:uncharacterized protein LOC111552898 [Piliocolobus tephrosceles]|uniref:uncharacterized protein LOC111552898 n=1 Tax=Piliocolobus tephrosceles TaxID=591936 RepID=UPI000E6B24A5|nr:uncharacterized protein LOC111552898 [Piliocolobus tephrosceles]